jgi:prepilin-type N-terminal cleavage/methylation domain-containing protein
MRKLYKNKAGFSLIEMVLVIAIICILAAVFMMSISTYIQSNRNRSNAASAARSSVVVDISLSEDQMRALGFEAPAGSAT